MKVLEVRAEERISFVCESKFKFHHIEWMGRFALPEGCVLQIYMDDELQQQFSIKNELFQKGAFCVLLTNSRIYKKKINGSRYYFFLTSTSKIDFTLCLFITEVEKGKFSFIKEKTLVNSY